jgi:hypothetical protein
MSHNSLLNKDLYHGFEVGRIFAQPLWGGFVLR